MSDEKQPNAFDWDLLRIFLIAVQAGSYTRAASMLEMNRTTVGRKINLLEEQLDLKLFELTDDGYQPTQAGQRLIEQASEIKTHIDELFGDIYSINNSLHGSVRLAYQEGFGELVLPVATQLIEQHPSLQIVCNETHNPLADLRNRKSDAAIAIAKQVPSSLEAETLGAVTRQVYSNGADMQRFDQISSWVNNSNDPEVFDIERWEAKNLASSVKKHRVNSVDGLTKAISKRLGHGLLWTCTAPSSLSVVEGAAEPGALQSVLVFARVARIPMSKRIAALRSATFDLLPSVLAR